MSISDALPAHERHVHEARHGPEARPSMPITTTVSITISEGSRHDFCFSIPCEKMLMWKQRALLCNDALATAVLPHQFLDIFIDALDQLPSTERLPTAAYLCSTTVLIAAAT